LWQYSIYLIWNYRIQLSNAQRQRFFNCFNFQLILSIAVFIPPSTHLNVVSDLILIRCEHKNRLAPIRMWEYVFPQGWGRKGVDLSIPSNQCWQMKCRNASCWFQIAGGFVFFGAAFLSHTKEKYASPLSNGFDHIFLTK